MNGEDSINEKLNSERRPFEKLSEEELKTSSTLLTILFIYFNSHDIPVERAAMILEMITEFFKESYFNSHDIPVERAAMILEKTTEFFKES